MTKTSMPQFSGVGDGVEGVRVGCGHGGGEWEEVTTNIAMKHLFPGTKILERETRRVNP